MIGGSKKGPKLSDVIYGCSLPKSNGDAARGPLGKHKAEIPCWGDQCIFVRGLGLVLKISYLEIKRCYNVRMETNWKLGYQFSNLTLWGIKNWSDMSFYRSTLFWTTPNVFQNLKISSEHQVVVFDSDPKQFWTHRRTRYESKNSMNLFFSPIKKQQTIPSYCLCF